jgi:ubiquitin C-terminal hydrolase
MAECYGRLVNDLWTTDKGVISPRGFHAELTSSSMLSQFGGSDQHDAQELLACLLDGLSEDLNLVHNKPYIQNPDSDGRSDYELADIWWSNHLKRENSVLQSIFTGMYVCCLLFVYIFKMYFIQ